jgi:hypothetical protein
MSTKFPREGRIHVHDTHVGVWEEGKDSEDIRVNIEPALGEVWLLLRAHLEGRGWTLGPDPRVNPIRRPRKRLSRADRAWYDAFDARWQEAHRVGRKGDLEMWGEAVGGRTLNIEFFQNVLRPPHPNRSGGRYEFNKMLGMPRHLRLLCAVEMVRVIRFLMTLGYKVGPEMREPFALSVLRIGEGRAEQWSTPFTPAELLAKHGTIDPYARLDRDGVLLAPGDERCLYSGRRGRLERGRVYPAGGMWNVYAHDGTMIHRVNASELFSLGASMRRRRRPKDPARHLRRLQVELKRATLAGDARRIAALKGAVVRHGGDPGDELLYVLSLAHSHATDRLLTWWGPNDSGYSVALEGAGKYTSTDISKSSYYNDGDRSIAIPCEIVDGLAIADSDWRVVEYQHLRSLRSLRQARAA